jgi:hypothetical protein
LEAEGLRLSHRARRTGVRIVLGCFAGALLLAAVGFAHIAIWNWLREYLAAQYVAAIFAGVDLVLALVLGVLAVRSVPGRVELEALAVRRQALEQVAASVTISALVVRVFDQLIRSRRRQ